PSVRSSASLRTLRVFPPPPPPAFYTLSLHDALPIWESVRFASERSRVRIPPGPPNKKNPNPFLYGNRFGFFFVRVYAPDGVFRALPPKRPRPGSCEASIGAGAFVLYDEGQASAGEGCGV